jgi:DNA-directed RNA polymerase subunit E'/Rpb7
MLKEKTQKRVNKEFTNKEKKEFKISPNYSRTLITKTIVLSITDVGKNIKDVLEKYIAQNFEGKCLDEGFVRPDSTQLTTFSSGLIQQGSQIYFQVAFECYVCFPVEGMLFKCKITHINKSGIKAVSATENPSPIDVFVARDHHFSQSGFSNLQEGDEFVARVIGARFELNEPFVSIIAEWVPSYKMMPKKI